MPKAGLTSRQNMPDNSSTSAKSFKFARLPWLVSLVAFDIVVILGFVFPELIGAASMTQITAARAAVAFVLPVAVLLLSGLLSHGIKASLVYWKVFEALPAHEAFSKHGPRDARIDLRVLEKNIGDFPSMPAEQNRLWFKLYKALETQPAIVEAQKMYLLYRDMAAISSLLLIVVPVGLYLNGAAFFAVWTVAGVFALQYLIAAVAARHSGIRFVTNVLAGHSAIHPSASSNPSASRKRKPSVVKH
jgi:hypothetical protein